MGVLNMKDANQIKRQFEELFESLRQRRRNAEETRMRATKEAADAGSEINVVDAALSALKPAQSFYNLAAFTDEQAAKSKVSPGSNREAIAAIISTNDRPMKASDIAVIAHKEGKIKSDSGYKGVYATVSTVLSRNRKHFFVQVGDHKWDIRSRGINLTSAGSSSRKESAGPAEMRGASRFNAFEKILKNEFPPAPEKPSSPPMPTALRKMTS
jgi:hypothetical protein